MIVKKWLLYSILLRKVSGTWTSIISEGFLLAMMSDFVDWLRCVNKFGSWSPNSANSTRCRYRKKFTLLITTSLARWVGASAPDTRSWNRSSRPRWLIHLPSNCCWSTWSIDLTFDLITDRFARSTRLSHIFKELKLVHDANSCLFYIVLIATCDFCIVDNFHYTVNFRQQFYYMTISCSCKIILLHCKLSFRLFLMLDRSMICNIWLTQ